MENKVIPQPIAGWINRMASTLPERYAHDPAGHEHHQQGAKYGAEALYHWIESTPRSCLEYVVNLFGISDAAQMKTIAEQEEKLAAYEGRITEDSARVVKVVEDNRQMAEAVEAAKEVIRKSTELIRVQSEKIAKLEKQVINLEDIRRITRLALIQLRDGADNALDKEINP